ncbi:MAG: tRNA dihydrouridine(20/20a) synthase DusA [Gammaproteobacteria bacterium]|nr:tRNA dihydrouridine(20/20a) synthase DusA [Gammaproteobacteria bacterium]
MSSVLHCPLSIAPMVNWTNTHFRRLMRLIAPQALLYTEMEPLQAVLRRKKTSVHFDIAEHPIALQLGGSDLAGLVESVNIAQEIGFDEVNLNLGCPSKKVQQGRFGACLMKEGDHVAACITAMKHEARIPVTVKMRIGVDEWDSLDFFLNLATQLVDAGVDKLIIHARSAWLKGLNPKQNRTAPPLKYDYVYALKQRFPQLPVIINGQVDDIEKVQAHLAQVDGVMIGRLACRQPYALADIHRVLHPETPILSPKEVVHTYLDYAYQQASEGEPFPRLCRPLFSMAHGEAHAKRWKHALMRVRSMEDLHGLKGCFDVLY